MAIEVENQRVYSVTIKMTDIDYCIICGNPVNFETDPSVCSEQCKYWFEVEVAFNRAAKKGCSQ